MESEERQREDEAITAISILFGDLFSDEHKWWKVFDGGGAIHQYFLQALKGTFESTVNNARAVLASEDSTVDPDLWEMDFEDDMSLADLNQNSKAEEGDSSAIKDLGTKKRRRPGRCDSASVTARARCKNGMVADSFLEGPTDHVLPTLEYWLRFSVAIYGWRLISLTHPQEFHRKGGYGLNDTIAFTQYSGLHPSYILQHRWKAETYKPAFVVALDPRVCAVVVAIRGSLEPGDFLTDLVASSSAFLDDKNQTIGQVHLGILKAAEDVMAEIREPLEQASKRVGGVDNYNLVICGHSLGGGVATVLGAILKYRERTKFKFSVLAYGPPPVLDKEP